MKLSIILYIVLPIAGIFLGWIFRWIYARFQLSASEQKAERVRQDAIREAEAQKKEILIQAREQLIQERNQQEKETVNEEPTFSHLNAGLQRKKNSWTREPLLMKNRKKKFRTVLEKFQNGKLWLQFRKKLTARNWNGFQVLQQKTQKN